jgi:hypothetical protein
MIIPSNNFMYPSRAANRGKHSIIQWKKLYDVGQVRLVYHPTLNVAAGRKILP